MSSASSVTMWTSTDDWRCQEPVRHMRSPKCSCAQRNTSSALIDSTSGSGSAGTSGSGGGGGVAKPRPLQWPAAAGEPQRLERDDLLGRDVPEVHRRPE